MTQTTSLPWWQNAIFYHIYPLGLCGALTLNDFRTEPVDRIQKIVEWIPHLRELGVNALYLGPVFESTYHGYDTANYYRVDRRLGSNINLARVSQHLHKNGIRLVLDGVFNHVGRDFFAFRDVQQKGRASEYCSWFANLCFDSRSSFGDSFSYEGWSGNYDLVKLNLANPAVRDHLFGVVRAWVEEFGIDGLRLDAADVLDADFLRELRLFTLSFKPDFWLMGEIVSGDYRRLANPDMLHSVTNYECYKGLYSSLVDKNYFEIAWSLNRQFGPEGLYKDLMLYNFADNHDVDRVASSLGDPALLFPLYCLLYTMPGIPSIYYGSEWGLTGKRTRSDDSTLRPNLDLHVLQASSPQLDLPGVLRRLANLRESLPVLRDGGYAQLSVSHQQFAFLRAKENERMVVAINSAAEPAAITIPLPFLATRAVDLLNNNETFTVLGNKLELPTVPPRWARVLKLE